MDAVYVRLALLALVASSICRTDAADDLIPKCPTTAILKKVITVESDKRVLNCNADDGDQIGDDVIYYISGKVPTLSEIVFKGPPLALQGYGLEKFDILLSNDGNRFNRIKTVDMTQTFGIISLGPSYKARYVKFVVVSFKRNACLSFDLKGCQAPTCADCPNSYYCRTKRVKCGFPKVCSRRPVCSCPPGMVLSADKSKCTDIDECASSPCSHKCENTPGSYKCSCPDGYKLKLDWKTCKDIDECASFWPPCSDTCTNTPGSYNCSCPAGYELGPDKKTCKDIDECSKPSGCTQGCINSAGSYDCSCYSGYVLNPDGKTCDDIDECKDNNGGCEKYCKNQPGSYHCYCDNGFRLTAGGKCEDINECDSRICTDFCNNTIGSFVCYCKKGYKLQSQTTCVDIDECADASLNKCDLKTTACQNYGGSYGCECKPNHVKKDQYSCLALTCSRLPQDSSIVYSPSSCSQSGEKKSGFTCSATCTEGYNSRMTTPAVLTCKPTGDWSGVFLQCQRVKCPPKPNPSNGFLQPYTCVSFGRSYNEECNVLCDKGYRLKGSFSYKCTKDGTWYAATEPKCAKIVLRPVITCGQDVAVILSKGSATADITANLVKPTVKNVDPSAIVIDTPNFDPKKVPYGRRVVTFSASNSAGKATCSIIVTVEDKEPPTVVFCPKNMKIKSGTNSKVVTWKKPEFRDNVKVVSVNSNRQSGAAFVKGSHTVEYVAKDDARNEVKCQFTIDVEFVPCKAPKIRNGVVNCNLFSGQMFCTVQCSKGFAMFHFFPISICRDGTKGFNVPIRDCVTFTTRKSTSETCPNGSIPEKLAGGLKCVRCPIGSYQDGANNCKNCPAGKTTNGEGSLDVSSCQ